MSRCVLYWRGCSEINGCKKGTTRHCNGKSKYNGCDGHYSEQGHAVLAADIIPQFRQVMGWYRPPLLTPCFQD
eukprot:COSAG05_NODE_273_length_12440_cov_22.182805_3_plen_73_part_00